MGPTASLNPSQPLPRGIHVVQHNPAKSVITVASGEGDQSPSTWISQLRQPTRAFISKGDEDHLKTKQLT